MLLTQLSPCVCRIALLLPRAPVFPAGRDWRWFVNGTHMRPPPQPTTAHTHTHTHALPMRIHTRAHVRTHTHTRVPVVHRSLSFMSRGGLCVSILTRPCPLHTTGLCAPSRLCPDATRPHHKRDMQPGLLRMCTQDNKWRAVVSVICHEHMDPARHLHTPLSPASTCMHI